MSLSPKDDPRTWLVPGPRAVPRPPLRARLPYYDLTTNERALLDAMCEHCSDGTCCWASLETYALHSGLSVRTIWNLLHGRKYRNGRYTRGLLERRILIEQAPKKKPSKGQRHISPATYLINEPALSLKPEVVSRLEAGVQLPLPKIRRPSMPGEPVEVTPDDNRHQVPMTTGTGCIDNRHQVHRQPAPGADDSKASNSRSTDSEEGEAKALPPKFSQADFDERDIRKLAAAWREADQRPSSVGGLSEKQRYEWVCVQAGVTIGRALYLDKLQRTWPSETQQAFQEPPAVCDMCGGYGTVGQVSNVPGPRSIPCPKCGSAERGAA